MNAFRESALRNVFFIVVFFKFIICWIIIHNCFWYASITRQWRLSYMNVFWFINANTITSRCFAKKYWNYFPRLSLCYESPSNRSILEKKKKLVLSSRFPGGAWMNLSVFIRKPTWTLGKLVNKSIYFFFLPSVGVYTDHVACIASLFLVRFN